MALPALDPASFQQFVSDQLAQTCSRIIAEYERAHAVLGHASNSQSHEGARALAAPSPSSSPSKCQALAQPRSAEASNGQTRTASRSTSKSAEEPAIGKGHATESEDTKESPLRSSLKGAVPGPSHEVHQIRWDADLLAEKPAEPPVLSEESAVLEEITRSIDRHSHASSSSSGSYERGLSNRMTPPSSAGGWVRHEYVIHPEASAYRMWCHCVSLVVVFSTFFTPVRYAFGNMGGVDDIDYVIDGLFAADVLLSFNVAFRAPAGLVWKRRTIFWHQVRTSQFWIDMCAVLPFAKLASVAGASQTVSNALTLFRLLRVYRIVVMFRDLQKSARTNLVVVVMAKFVTFILLWTHIAGCILYALARERDFGPETWVFKASPELPSMSSYTRYTHMLYWAVGTFKAGPAHGDLTPSTDVEMIWSCVAMMCNICLQTYLVSSMAALLTTADVRIYAMRNRLSQLGEFAQRHSLKKELYNQVRAYTMFKFSVNQELDQNVMGALPEIYRQRISHALYDDILKNVPVFLGCSKLFLKQLHGALESMWHMEGHDLVKEEDSSGELQILAEGIAGLYYHSHEIDSVSSGDSLTAIPFICQVSQQYSVRTKCLCRILSLHRSPWEAACNSYPEDLGQVKFNLLKQCELRLRQFEMDTPAYEAYSNMLRVVENHLANSREAQTASLCFAASTGDIDKMKRILKGHSANCADYDTRAPIHIAAAKGQVAALQLLIGAAADVNMMDNFGCTPLMEALRSRQNNAAELLFSSGANLGFEEMVPEAPRTARSSASGVSTSTLQSPSPETLTVTNQVQPKNAAGELCEAASDPHQIWYLSSLIKFSADVNSADYDGRTALHVASASGNQAAVRLLVKHSQIKVDVRDNFGRTPLMEAVRHGHEPCARMLKSRGAFHGFCTDAETNEDANAVHAGQELCQAAFANQVTYLNNLVNFCGLSVDTPDYDLRTALMLSCCSGHADTAVTLVQLRADVYKKDRWGHTAISEAKAHGHSNLADLLQRLHAEKERALSRQ